MGIPVLLPEEGIQYAFNTQLPHDPQDGYERAKDVNIPWQVCPDLFNAIFLLNPKVLAVIPDLLFLLVPVGSHFIEIFPAVDRFLSQVCLQCNT